MRTMITVTVEQKRGACTSQVKVSAESIERAVEIVGRGADSARLVLPIDGDDFFVHAANEGARDTPEEPRLSLAAARAA